MITYADIGYFRASRGSMGCTERDWACRAPRDQLTEELRTGEQLAQLLAPLLAAVARAWAQEPLPEAGVTVDH